MILNEYNYMLYAKFQSATGTKTYTDDDIDNFKNWIFEQQIIAYYYRYCLDRLGLKFYEDTSAEIGNGRFDTVALAGDLTILVTPFFESFDDISAYNIVKGNLRTTLYNQWAYFEDAKKRYRSTYSLEQVESFYCHNIFNPSFLYDFIKIHNSGKNIILGAYGNLHDLDRLDKIEMLKSIRSSLNDNKWVTNKDAYFQSGNQYAYVLYTKKLRSN